MWRKAWDKGVLWLEDTGGTHPMTSDPTLNLLALGLATRHTGSGDA